MPNSYSYSPGPHPGDFVRTVDVDCGRCCAGVFEITVADDRTVTAVVSHCYCDRLQFESDYDNGMHGDAIRAAIREADRLEAEGPPARQLDALYDTAGGNDDLHRMAEARRYK